MCNIRNSSTVMVVVDARDSQSCLHQDYTIDSDYTIDQDYTVDLVCDKPCFCRLTSYMFYSLLKSEISMLEIGISLLVPF
jgi:hypothetical protein